MLSILLLLQFLAIASAEYKEFPPDFLFGTASSSYQVEGAWNTSGKGESIWDRFVHTRPDKVLDGSTADIGCDSYHKIKEDVAALKNLGVQFYRFSLSWPRILPTGHIDQINHDGIRYYNDLINELLANDIIPLVTMFHWDLPQSMQDLGGWPNPFLVDFFADFARVAFESFGDRVKFWITFNEPYHICQSGYHTGILAPGLETNEFGKYMCSYTVLKAHAKAYHIYDEDFRNKQKGKIGIAVDTFWYEPLTDTEEDIQAANLVLQMNFAWFMNPIFSKQGDWPKLMKERVLKISTSHNLRRSKLPTFTPEEINYIKGTSDFLGLNHYSTYAVKYGDKPDASNPFYPTDSGAMLEQLDHWETTPTFWIRIVPWGLRKLLNWIKQEYNNPIVYITESGVGDTEMVINDEKRVKYYQGYLGAILDAIREDGCNVKGYSAWSFMDNYEWNSGYQLRFGLHLVDFNDPERKRIPKSSAIYYKKVIQSRRVDHEYEPVSTNKFEL